MIPVSTFVHVIAGPLTQNVGGESAYDLAAKSTGILLYAKMPFIPFEPAGTYAEIIEPMGVVLYSDLTPLVPA